MRRRKRNPPNSLDELFGCNDLSDCLGEDLELGGNVGASIGGALKTAGSVASLIPGVGGVIGGAASALGNLLGGGGGPKKSFSPADIIKKAKASVNKQLVGTPAEGKYSPKPTMAQTALAAPVPMAAPSMPAINLYVQPYGQDRTTPPTPTADSIAQLLADKLGGNVSLIADKVRTLELQNQATSEHNALTKQKDFQRQVINSLRRIAAQTGR